jgi:Family of unknown function (DUF6492)
MVGNMSADVTVVTPCHASDLERFAFLRESMTACGVDLPHVVVVPDDQRSLFARFETHSDLRVCTEAEVLPGRLVRQLRRGPNLPDRIRHRLTGRRFLRLHWGWMVQQYVKLSVGRVVDTSMWVCVDSDTFFVRHMDAQDFHSTRGRPLLLEPVDCPNGPTSIEFRDASARLLGLTPETVDPRVFYTSWVVPMERGVVDELLRFVECRRRGHWWEAMAQTGATEYETYGLFARHIHGLRNVDPEDRRWCFLFYDVTKLDAMLRYAIHETGAKTAMVDAHLTCDFSGVKDVVRSHWTAER